MVIELSTSPDILKLPAKLGFFSFASCGRVLKKQRVAGRCWAVSVSSVGRRGCVQMVVAPAF